jgi:hypothetical protein
MDSSVGGQNYSVKQPVLPPSHRNRISAQYLAFAHERAVFADKCDNASVKDRFIVEFVSHAP